MIPARGLLLVKPIETAETLPGGRVLLTADHRERLTANQAEVIAVGAFALCDAARSRAERKCTRPHIVLEGLRLHAHAIRAGDWILIRPRSYVAGPDPLDSVRFVHQDAVLGIFNEPETTP